MSPSPSLPERELTRRANLRAAWILASIAVCFFVGIILAQAIGKGAIGIAVLGFAIVGFLGLAIGRNLRR
jgi:hypothetical protein